MIKVAEEMEVATASDNSQRLLKLIHDTGGRQTVVIETACCRTEESIHDRYHRLNR